MNIIVFSSTGGKELIRSGGPLEGAGEEAAQAKEDDEVADDR